MKKEYLVNKTLQGKELATTPEAILQIYFLTYIFHSKTVLVKFIFTSVMSYLQFLNSL